MSETIHRWVWAHALASAWGYLAEHWLAIALFLAAAAAVCVAARKLVARFGRTPLVVGVVILIAWAWWLGRGSATASERVRRVVETVVKVVEKPVVDHAALDRLRKQLDDLKAKWDARPSAPDPDGTALDRARRELAAANAEIRRLTAELAAKPKVLVADEEFNAQCPRCGHLFNIGSGLRNDLIRCRKCKYLDTARTFWACRAYARERQGRR